MSDGPFKNMNLAGRWKRFAKAMQYDGFDCTESCGLASDALVHEILTSEFQGLLADYHSYAKQDQLNIAPLSTVESIFNRHSKTPIVDNLQKEVMFRLSKRASPVDAMQQAMYATLGEQIRLVKNRFVDKCIEDKEAGEMRPSQFNRAVSQVNSVFEALPKRDICQAILALDKYAFKGIASKKVGIDEGAKL